MKQAFLKHLTGLLNNSHVKMGIDFTTTIYYVFSGRFPSEKAHALYVAKVADSFQSKGYRFVVVASSRGTLNGSAQTFFKNTHPLEVVYLPTLDFSVSRLPKKVVFFINYICFTLSTFFFFLFKKKSKVLIFTNESVPALILSHFRKKVVYEMHDYPENYHRLFKNLFKRVFRILTQNEWKKEKLKDDFGIAESKIIVEPNGVEIEKFDISMGKEEARRHLNLSLEKFLVVYTGHLFDWKGADVLASAAALLPQDQFQVIFVGGSPDDVVRFKKVYGGTENIMCVGYRPHEEIPLWQKAADCLVLPNTAKMNISKYYTSPMKLFEYMASGTPIIASDLPSIRSIVTDQEVTFVPADDAQTLVTQIQKVRSNYAEYTEKVLSAQKKVKEHTWSQRAIRIINNVNHTVV